MNPKPESSSSPLLNLIRDSSLLDDLQLDEVREEHNRTGKPIGEILNDFGLIDSETQLQIIANHLGTEVVQIAGRELAPEVLSAVPADTARNYKCLPIAVFDSSIQLALADPLNQPQVDELGYLIHKEIVPVVADPKEIEAAITRYYGEAQSDVGAVLKELGSNEEIARDVAAAEAAGAAQDLADLAEATPIIKFVSLVLSQAVADRASDIHFEPFEDEFKIRYRVDGALYEMAPPPKNLALPVISRLKVMANLDPSAACPRTDASPSPSMAGRLICAFPRCPPSLANQWCSVCWTARRSIWTSKP
jgi:type IV pilus assembly protein PilB